MASVSLSASVADDVVSETRSAPAPDAEAAAWHHYCRQHERTAGAAILLSLGTLTLLFSFKDRLLEPEWFSMFLAYRLAVASSCAVALLVMRRTSSLSAHRLLCLIPLAMSGCFSAWGVLPRVSHLGEYFLGLLLLFCGSAAVLFWPLAWSVACFGTIVLAHWLSMRIGPGLTAGHAPITLDVFTGAVIAVVGVHVRRRLEHRNFRTSWVLDQRSRELAAAAEDARQTHARLAVAEKLGALGRVTAGVAHEINNPLTYVMANTAYLLDDLGPLASDERWPEPVRTHLLETLAVLREINQGSERVKKIVRDLREFSRPDDEISASVDLRKVIETSIGMTWNEIRHRARLIKDFQEVDLVRGVESRLVQLFVNLIINAAQAIDEGRAEHNEIRLTLRRRPGGGAIVAVQDTGAGIAPENLSRIFDPFFTTKAVGAGTGLGLSVCCGVVRAHGGDLRVESELGRGTVVTVELLLIGGGDRQPGPAAPAAAVRPARILVIDDEPGVGSALRRLLRQHQVEYCESGEAALDVLRKDGRYDVILCDVMMPEMTGIEVYERVKQFSPELARRMVFLTGGAFTASAKAQLGRLDAVCLEKPADRAEVLRIIEQVRR